MGLADVVRAGGFAAGDPLALVAATDGIAVAWSGHSAAERTGEPDGVLARLEELEPRFVWWSARDIVHLLRTGRFRPRACWDLGAVARLLHGLSRDDPAAVWAAHRELPEPPVARGEPDLLDLEDDGEAVRPDGQLSREWVRGGWRESLARAEHWATLALDVWSAQHVALHALPDPRRAPRRPPLAVLTAHAESAAALLAVELERDGLPLDRDVATTYLTSVIGPRPVDPGHATARRQARDAAVLATFPAGALSPDEGVDLRNPAQVRTLLQRIGLDLPDTRSWRLEPHAASLPPVAALLAWRKAERLATTYGWAWLDGHVGADGRLRGAWTAAEGAGRMSAQAGLHNMPAELRPCVRADPGWTLVRADLGQVEPRVLAVVSGDDALAAAAREDDMYAPVAAALGCDRPTAKVAVLAAMYGQTSGAAGAALRDMERAYPRALAYLRAAEESGRMGRDLRTYGGRLLRLSAAAGHPTAGRFARNAVVQGAAAELFKAWAVTVRAGLNAGELAAGELAGTVSSPGRGRIVLCLHDELLLHVPAADADAAAELLTSALDATSAWWAAGSGVRFVADVSAAASWADAH